jgi:hypothetical protein
VIEVTRTMTSVLNDGLLISTNAILCASGVRASAEMQGQAAFAQE